MKKQNHDSRSRLVPTLLLLVAIILACSLNLYAEDTPAPTQGVGEHSTVCTSDGSIRDDELADFVAQQIQANGGHVKDVKIMVNSCYGGGLLDDFQRVFGPGGACAGTPWVGGAASAADETAKGWGDKVVNSKKNKDKKLGSCWTSALAGKETSDKDTSEGSIRDKSTNNVKEDFEAASAKDDSHPNNETNPKYIEHPVVASGNGGDKIKWHETKHQAVVFGGSQTNQRHHNNVDNVEASLKEVWPEGSYNINKIDGGTTQDLNDAIAEACENLDDDTELVIYIDDHGNTEFDIDEFLDWLLPFDIFDYFDALFSLHPGWVEGLQAMYDQPGDTPLPTLNLTLAEPINGSEWNIQLNGVPIPLPSELLSGELQLHVDWTSIQTGENHLEIFPTGTPSGPMSITNLELSSGPINEIEKDLHIADHIYWWTNAGPDSNLWSDANNWYTMDWNDVNEAYEKSDVNSVPGPDDIACIGQGADWFPYPNGVSALGPIGNCLIDSSVTAECYQLWIGADPCDPNQPNHLEMTGGSLTIRVTSDDWVGLGIVWNTGGIGSMTISGDSIVDIGPLGFPPEGGNLNVGGYEDGVGTLTMLDNCTVTCYHFDCPDAWEGEEDMEAHFNLYGGTLYTTADEPWHEFWLGLAGTSPNSTMDITEGKVVITSHDEQELDAIMGWIEEGKITAFGGDPNFRAEIYADYDITNPGKTTVQAIATEPEQAWNPKPCPGATVDYRPVSLSWTPGDYADSHVVYLSSDRDAVINGTAPNTPTAPNSIGAGDLEFSTHYFWRVDEANDPCLWPGLVWDFKTDDHLTVDDMDSYGPDPAMRNVWKDYWSGSLFGKNGAEVFVETNPDFVRSGQSMKFYHMSSAKYNKAAGKYVGSCASANVAALGTGNNDWTVSGAKALVVYFFGDPLNGLDTTHLSQDWMYVKLGSGDDNVVIKYDGDMNDVREAWWHDWNIELQDFNDSGIRLDDCDGINLSNVERVSIGFGGYYETGQTAPGAGGAEPYFVGDTVWFDDIRLYPTRCVPEFAPVTDLTNDCITDYSDFEIMAGDWPESGPDLPGDLSGNDKVDFLDYSIFASYWLTEILWP